MSLLNGITSGPKTYGLRMVIAGQEKVGKTTFGASAPSVLLIPVEAGFAMTDVPKTPMATTFLEYTKAIDDIIAWCAAGSFPYKTIFTDSMTALERLMHEHVLKMDPTHGNKSCTMESAHGGYGKAYNMANALFNEILAKFDVLAVTYGINILLTCHVFSAKVIDATVGEYTSWDLLLHSPKNEKTYGKREMITQWADVVGFLYEPKFKVSAEGKGGMTTAVSQNKGHVMGVSRTASYVAGNRFKMVGEIPIPVVEGWNYFAHSLYQASGLDYYKR